MLRVDTSLCAARDSKPYPAPKSPDAKEQKAGGRINGVLLEVRDAVCDALEWEGNQYMSSARDPDEPIPELSMGVDLGATNGCVAFWEEGNVGIISDQQGRTMRKRRDMLRKADTSKLGKPGGKLCAIYARMRKETRMNLFPRHCSRCVLTVPISHSAKQRAAAKRAATDAGWKVLAVITSPVAAGLAYGLDKPKLEERAVKINGRSPKSRGVDAKRRRAAPAGQSLRKRVVEVPQHVIVFDIGGSSLNVTLLRVMGGVFKVKACAGSSQFGGNLFDDVVANALAEDFKKENRGADPRRDPKGRRKLLDAVEKAKKQLSLATSAAVACERIYEGLSINVMLSRKRFETLCQKSILQVLMPLGRVLSDAKMTVKDIDHVIAVGGSTRIPRIRQLLRDFFNGKEVKMSIPPDEVGAHGAAIQAALLMKPPSTRLSIGVKVAGGALATVVPRFSDLRSRWARKFTTHTDKQSKLSIALYEGERPKAAHNRLLGTVDFTLAGPVERGGVTIVVTAQVAADRTVLVTVRDLSGAGSVVRKTLQTKAADEEAETKHMDEVGRNEIGDEGRRDRIHFLGVLEDMVNEMRNSILSQVDESHEIDDWEIDIVREACHDMLLWIAEHPVAKRKAAIAEMGKLQNKVRPIIEKLASGPEVEEYIFLD